MKRKQENKFPYLTPWCEVIRMEQVNLICTSVSIKTSETTEEDWENDQDIDGGEIEL
ncbi:MAG: hypothetical protein ACTTK2_07000 [Hoylesella marshii]|uniref:hypothetical protein n=1 Tax=Hoylesella marshii TaxID=189722 RepID=UPI003F9FB606